MLQYNSLNDILSANTTSVLCTYVLVCLIYKSPITIALIIIIIIIIISSSSSRSSSTLLHRHDVLRDPHGGSFVRHDLGSYHVITACVALCDENQKTMTTMKSFRFRCNLQGHRCQVWCDCTIIDITMVYIN